MGNVPSKLEDNQESIERKDRAEIKSEPIKTPAKRTPIVSDSLVTGSPLGLAEQDNVDISAFFSSRAKASFAPQTLISSPGYVQPASERTYQNNSRIVHAFGPSGLAPLTSLSLIIVNKG